MAASGEWASVERIEDSQEINDVVNSISPTTPSLLSYLQGESSYGKFVSKEFHSNLRHSSRRMKASSASLRKVINGSLVILGATRDFESQYLCQASNGVGSGISKVISITVLGMY